MTDFEIQIATQDHCPTATQIKRWIKAALDEQKKSGQVVVRIVDEHEMITLNHQYRKKEKPTNVLSFKSQLPPNLGAGILGDIVICASVVAKESLLQKKTLEQHWAHMVVHGVLHLLGYDHENDQDANVMENHEIAILDKLGFPSPYRDQTHE